MSSSSGIKLFEIFRFLAQVMRYPEADWFHDEFLSVYKNLLVDLKWPESAAMPDQVSPQFLEDIQVEYTRLFINAVPHVVAPPYGSIYIDGTLNSTTADKTRDYYRKHGFDITTNEFPDHIVTELDFAALREEEQEGGSDEFLAHYFRPWFDKFKDQVLAECEHPYFISAVKMIDFFTCAEEEDGV